MPEKNSAHKLTAGQISGAQRLVVGRGHSMHRNDILCSLSWPIITRSVVRYNHPSPQTSEKGPAPKSHQEANQTECRRQNIIDVWPKVTTRKNLLECTQDDQWMKEYHKQNKPTFRTTPPPSEKSKSLQRYKTNNFKPFSIHEMWFYIEAIRFYKAINLTRITTNTAAQ